MFHFGKIFLCFFGLRSSHFAAGYLPRYTIGGNMGRRFLNLIISTIVFALIIAGCEKDHNPISVTSDFDTRLIGEWFYMDSLSIHYPAPPIAFYGIQITSDRTIKELAVQIKTGKIDTVNNSRFLELIKANDSRLIVWAITPPGSSIDTMHYVVKEKELIVSNEYYKKTYKRTKLGSQITDPIDSDFGTMIDSTYYEGIEVYSYPPSFASKTSDTDLLISARIPDFHINIEINNFYGIGTYQIPFAKGKLILDGGDVFIIYLSDSTNTGTVSITDYDETENICSGTFSFDAIISYYTNNGWVLQRKKLRQGSFSLPIYE
jgi:hypothetical protein